MKIKPLLFLLLVPACLSAQEAAEAPGVSFYAYTPKLLSLGREAYLPFSWDYAGAAAEDEDYGLEHSTAQRTSLNWVLPLLNKGGWSVLNETELRFSNAYLAGAERGGTTVAADARLPSNFLNSFLKVNWVIPVGEAKQLVFSAQGNYFGHDVVDFQKAGGSATAMIYTRNTDRQSVAFGLTYDFNHHMRTIVPLVVYYQKMPRDLMLEIFLPWKIGLLKVVNERTFLYLGSRLGVQLDFVPTRQDIFLFSKDLYETRDTYVKNHFRVQRALSDWLWLELELGQNYSFMNYMLEPTAFNAGPETVHMAKTNGNSTFYGQLGVFLRPVSLNR